MSDLKINGQSTGIRELRKFTLDLTQQEQDLLDAKVQKIAQEQGVTAPEDLIALRGQAFIEEIAKKAETKGLMKDGYDSATIIDENGNIFIGYGDKLNFDQLYDAQKKGVVPTMTLDGKPVQLLFADDEINGFTDGVANQWGAGNDGRDAAVTIAKLGSISTVAGVTMTGVYVGALKDAVGPASTANKRFMSKLVGAPVSLARKVVNSNAIDRALSTRAGKWVAEGTARVGRGLTRFGLGALVVAGAVAIGNTIYGGYRGLAESNSKKMDVLNELSEPIQ